MTKLFLGMKLNRAAVVVLLGCVSALVIGCSMGNTLVGPPDNSAVTGAALQGKVYGGRQAISGATIQLWAVGASGYGSTPTPLISATVTTSDGTGTMDSNANAGNANNTLPAGSFTITGDYTCPAAPSNGNGNTYVYITSQGGNPGSGANNPNVMLTAALGSCSALVSNAATTFITINEVTTAATAFALGQYFTTTFGNSSADGFGAPNTTQAQVGLANAFATVNSLVNIGTGAAVTSAILPSGCTLPGTVANPCVTATPEATKLNTVADILAACVNSIGISDPSGTCTTLFGDTVPTAAVTPTDTLQAAVDMSLNPTSNNANGSTTNLAALYGLVASSQPFTASSTQPTDWTIGIQYTDQTTATFFLQPQNIAADSNGNIWVGNSSGSATNGSLVEVSPTGIPLQNTLTSSTAGTGVATATPRNIAIDTNNNVWIATSSSSAYIFEVSPAGATLGSATTSKSSYGIAIDGSNDVFVGSASSSSHYQLYEFPAGNINTPYVYPTASSTPGTANTNPTTASNDFLLPEYMAFDTTGNLWMTNGSGGPATGSINSVVQLSNINTTQCVAYAGTYPCPTVSGSTSGPALTTSTTENTYTAYSPSGAAFAEAFGIAAGPSGMWVANATTANNTVSTISLSGGSGAFYGSVTSLASPRYVAVDGAGDAWVVQHGGTSGGNEVTEFSSSGAILSPINSGTAPFIAVGFAHPGMASSYGIAIDPSGNVWVANNTATAGIFEIVGAAAPTVTPIALALKNTAVGAKP